MKYKKKILLKSTVLKHSQNISRMITFDLTNIFTDSEIVRLPLTNTLEK